MAPVTPRRSRRTSLRPLRRRWLWGGLWMAMIAGTIIVCLGPPPPVPAAAFDGFDKLEHLGGYLVLAAMARALFATRLAQGTAGLALVLLGIGIEIAQGQLTVAREPDVWDAVANTTGVALGLAARGAERLLAWVDARLF